MVLPGDKNSVFNADGHKTSTNVVPSRSRCSRSVRFKNVPTWFCPLESMYDNQECSHALLFLQFCVFIAFVDCHLTVGGQSVDKRQKLGSCIDLDKGVQMKPYGGKPAIVLERCIWVCENGLI